MDGVITGGIFPQMKCEQIKILFVNGNFVVIECGFEEMKVHHERIKN